MKYPTKWTHPKLQDGKGEFWFTVLPEHVQGSHVRDPEQCAGACALKDLPEIKNAWVMRTRTFLEHADGQMFKWANPVNLQKAVEKFDVTAGLFPPGEYKLVETEAREKVGMSHQPRGKVTPHRRGVTNKKYPSYALR